MKFRSLPISNSTFDSYNPFYDTIDESFDIKYSSFTKNWKTTRFSISSFFINPICNHHSVLHTFNSIHQLLTRKGYNQSFLTKQESQGLSIQYTHNNGISSDSWFKNDHSLSTWNIGGNDNCMLNDIKMLLYSNIII